VEGKPKCEEATDGVTQHVGDRDSKRIQYISLKVGGGRSEGADGIADGCTQAEPGTIEHETP
jgi:hypothetical protein